MTSTINPDWQDFKFYQEIKPRYGDFDTQLHVNNLAYLEMGESVRIDYYKDVGIWDGVIRPGGFGMLMASIKTDFVNSINYGDPVHIGYKTARIGNKSITFAFIIKTHKAISSMRAEKWWVFAMIISPENLCAFPPRNGDKNYQNTKITRIYYDQTHIT